MLRFVEPCEQRLLRHGDSEGQTYVNSGRPFPGGRGRASIPRDRRVSYDNSETAETTAWLVLGNLGAVSRTRASKAVPPCTLECHAAAATGKPHAAPLEPIGPCPYRLVFPVHYFRRVCAAGTLMDTSRLAFFWMRASYLNVSVHAALRVRASGEQQERDTAHKV